MGALGRGVRWVVTRPDALMHVLAEHLLIRWLRDARAGVHGPRAQAVLELVAGWKTWTGLGLGFLWYVGTQTGYERLAPVVGIVSAVLVGAGVTDKLVQTPGRPAALENSRAYKVLAEHGAALAALVGLWLEHAAAPGCTSFMLGGLAITCSLQVRAAQLLGFALLYLKIADRSMLSPTSAQVRATLPVAK